MAELIGGSTAGGYEILHRGNINGLTLNNLTLTGTITLDANAETLSPAARVLECIMLRLRTSRGLRV